jgi:hypothetical protein
VFRRPCTPHRGEQAAKAPTLALPQIFLSRSRRGKAWRPSNHFPVDRASFDPNRTRALSVRERDASSVAQPEKLPSASNPSHLSAFTESTRGPAIGDPVQVFSEPVEAQHIVWVWALAVIAFLADAGQREPKSVFHVSEGWRIAQRRRPARSSASAISPGRCAPPQGGSAAKPRAPERMRDLTGRSRWDTRPTWRSSENGITRRQALALGTVEQTSFAALIRRKPDQEEHRRDTS